MAHDVRLIGWKSIPRMKGGGEVACQKCRSVTLKIIEMGKGGIGVKMKDPDENGL